jgi:hypothetical protein
VALNDPLFAERENVQGMEEKLATRLRFAVAAKE